MTLKYSESSCNYSASKDECHTLYFFWSDDESSDDEDYEKNLTKARFNPKKIPETLFLIKKEVEDYEKESEDKVRPATKTEQGENTEDSESEDVTIPLKPVCPHHTIFLTYKDYLEIIKYMMPKDTENPDIMDRINIVRRTPRLGVLLQGQSLANLFTGDKDTYPEYVYLFNGRAKLMYHLHDKLMKPRIKEGDFSPTDMSEEEIQSFCKDTSQIKISPNLTRHGGSIPEVTTGQHIPSHMVKQGRGFVIGHSHLYKCFEIGEIYRVINLSPPQRKYVTDKFDRRNTLYHYLLKVIKQLGHASYAPLLVEFTPDKATEYTCPEAMKLVQNFMLTIREAQKLYHGMIVCIAPPPYWEPGRDLESYLTLKKGQMRITELLTVYGLIYDVYVHCPLLSILPIETEEGQEYFLHKHFQKVPLYDTEGNPTEELVGRVHSELDWALDCLYKANYLIQ